MMGKMPSTKDMEILHMTREALEYKLNEAKEEGIEKGATMLKGAYQCEKHPKATNYVICTFCKAEQDEALYKKGKQKGFQEGIDVVEELHMDFLGFLQEQMEMRRSTEEGKIGKDERCTTEFLMLNMVWQQHLRIYYGLFPALDASKPFGSGRNKKMWIKVKKARKTKG